MNTCQHAIIDKIIKQGVKKWIAVGDYRQAIYSFSGSLSESYNMFKTKENVTEYPLDICYRCPTGVIKEANQVYDIMQPFKEDAGIVEVIETISDIQSESLVICRNTEPLISLLFELILIKRPAYIKGEDILNTLKRFLGPYKSMTTSQAMKEMKYQLEDYLESKDSEDKKKYFVLKENVKIYKKLMSIFYMETGSVKHLLDNISSLFVKKDKAVVLATIHKSKGLEADVVYILNEDTTIPSRFAKSKEQLQQEQNLKYVARTRAKKEMYYLNLKL